MQTFEVSGYIQREVDCDFVAHTLRVQAPDEQAAINLAQLTGDYWDESTMEATLIPEDVLLREAGAPTLPGFNWGF